ncbi:SDR family oxidoreductase [Bradyrhizobium sp. 143]|nr:SDR family oxidoreductase [Bradyrhizobium sp. 143]
MYGDANHAATKGAIFAATRSWAFELQSHHIRVNAARAKVRTELMTPLIDQIGEHLRRAGEPHDVTARELEYYEPEEAPGLAAWLASGLTSEITGRLFGIDGPKLTHYGVYPQADTFYHHPNWPPRTDPRSPASAKTGSGQQW